MYILYIFKKINKINSIINLYYYIIIEKFYLIKKTSLKVLNILI